MKNALIIRSALERRAHAMADIGFRGAIVLLSLAGAAVAAYLAYVRYTGASIACTTESCETVQGSSYATLGGISVAVIGLAGYAAILATALLRSRTAMIAGAALAAGGFAFSMYLLYAQVLVLEAVCQWCLTSDAILGVLAIVALARLLAAPPRRHG